MEGFQILVLVIGVSALSYWYGIRIGERVAKLKVGNKWNT